MIRRYGGRTSVTIIPVIGPIKTVKPLTKDKNPGALSMTVREKNIVLVMVLPSEYLPWR